MSQPASRTTALNPSTSASAAAPAVGTRRARRLGPTSPRYQSIAAAVIAAHSTSVTWGLRRAARSQRPDTPPPRPADQGGAEGGRPEYTISACTSGPRCRYKAAVTSSRETRRLRSRPSAARPGSARDAPTPPTHIPTASSRRQDRRPPRQALPPRTKPIRQRSPGPARPAQARRAATSLCALHRAGERRQARP